MLRYPEQYRVQSVYGLNSFFVPFNGKTLAVCASVDTDDKGIKWEHVSVGLKNRLPTCAELQFVKMLFWDPEDEYSVLHAPVQVRQVVQQLRSPLETNKHQASVGIATCVKV